MTTSRRVIGMSIKMIRRDDYPQTALSQVDEIWEFIHNVRPPSYKLVYKPQ